MLFGVCSVITLHLDRQTAQLRLIIYIFVYLFYRLNTSITVIYLGRHRQVGINPYEISRNVSRIITHPKYNPNNFDNDIALVQLSSSVNFTDYIRPVCLAASGSTFAADTDSWITGWENLILEVRASLSIKHMSKVTKLGILIVHRQSTNYK